MNIPAVLDILEKVVSIVGLSWMPLWLRLTLLGTLASVFLYLWSTFNAFIVARNKVKTDFADIDVQLKRRASLIENLVETVRDYAKHERKTFQEVASARSMLDKPHGAKELAKVENMLSATLRSLFALSEAYPKLVASENYRRLQNDIKETENLIAQYRETYNQTVLDYNTAIQIFPNLLVAGLFAFGEEELFHPEEAIAEVKISSK